MEVVAILLFLGLCIYVLVGLPAAGLWGLSQWLKRQNHRQAAIVIQFLLICLVVFCLSIGYSFYSPFDSELKGEFVQITGLPFPDSGEIIEGDISGFDLQGQYFSRARIEVNQQDYDLLLKSIRADTSFRAEPRAIGLQVSPLPIIFSKGSDKEGHHKSVRFLHDHRTIAFDSRSN